jgi:hypothetical protein
MLKLLAYFFYGCRGFFNFYIGKTYLKSQYIDPLGSGTPALFVR